MKYPNGTLALKDVSFEIKEGEFAFIVGHSGAGKSTLLKLMLKEENPTEGKIFINGKDFSKLKKSQIPQLRRSIGIVFQDFRLLPDRTVFENVAFAMRITGASHKKIKKQVPLALTLVGLGRKTKAFPTELSGGEQQRVGLARALINNPALLIADEPTGNLDPNNSAEIMKLLEEINANGTTVVVITHEKGIVNDMKKRVIELDAGTVIRDEEEGKYKNEATDI
jgi:cell division transport system ATP-binding protein